MQNLKDENTSDGAQKLREVFSPELIPYLLMVDTDWQMVNLRDVHIARKRIERKMESIRNTAVWISDAPK